MPAVHAADTWPLSIPTGIMANRDSFLLRMDPEVMEAIRHWARDDLRSVNGQIEFLLRRALRDAGRLSQKAERARKGKKK